jgi:threonylcarbamoyladenosine tRNA methylthiotransferase MtaB
MRYDEKVPTYHVENFGCRATQADGAAIERQFDIRGLIRSTALEADLVILNTCTVTNSADQDARAAIRRVRRKNPGAKIVVTGCYAQRAPQEIAALPGVSAVIGNSHKHQLAEIVLDRDLGSISHQALGWRGASSVGVQGDREGAALAAEVRPQSVPDIFLPVSTLIGNRQPATGSSIHVSDIFAHTELVAAPVFEANTRTRPNLKVQDGCDNRCSFCVIPSVRGHSRSLPAEKVIGEVNALVAAGYRELVISGINLGRWGRDLLGAQDFTALIRAILAQTKLQKLRISSVEPMDWTDDLIRLVAESPRIAKHAHVPLQSGSDAVLRRMHRKYRPWHYREKIEKIHAAVPDAAIGADVMVGFPGESDAEFECTRRLIEELPLTYLHVFTYSARPGTPAASMPHQVPVHIARERNKTLRDLAAEKKRAFMRRFVGKTIEAITLASSYAESQADAHCATFTEALTDNYQKLFVEKRHAPNQWVAVRIHQVQNDALIGRLP